MSLRFDNRVAIVTGAGGALGRAYALEFARRGAKVVVNDLGNRETKVSQAALDTVAEIKAFGGEAVANFDSVTNGAAVVQTAIDTWGRVDIVINNAGILRDTSLKKMKPEQWQIIQDIHLTGAFSMVKAAWPYMQKQEYGRIINTSSSSGLYGNFGQTNYSAAKMGLVGFTTACAKEGAKKNVYSNVIAPVAGSAMTKTVFPPDLVEALKPSYVAPVVCYLCHESAGVNGQIFEAGGGWVAQARVQRTEGAVFPLNQPFTLESVQGSWDKITDFEENSSAPTSGQEAFAHIMGNLETANEPIKSNL
jgi:NAD(P)-dependent dehydrogenase (short-subunit alcohol dehydrogenase family)